MGRALTNKIQQGRYKKDIAAIKMALMEYDDALEKYIPVLMAQARIYWDREHYEMVETIFKQSNEFCSEHDAWKLNFSHVYFMQGNKDSLINIFIFIHLYSLSFYTYTDLFLYYYLSFHFFIPILIFSLFDIENKYREAIKFYEQFVQQHMDNILDVTAIVLANLCVSYIMTSQNQEAEELMRKIEREEEKLGTYPFILDIFLTLLFFFSILLTYSLTFLITYLFISILLLYYLCTRIKFPLLCFLFLTHFVKITITLSYLLKLSIFSIW